MMPYKRSKPKPNPNITFKFEAIGTHWQIDIQQDLSLEQTSELLTKIKQRIAEFDQNYSRFRPDSLVIKMSKKGGEYTLPTDARLLIELYQQLYTITNGAFTPVIGQVLSDAGYDQAYSLQTGILHLPQKLDEIMTFNNPILILTQPALLDFGAAGKGYLIDIVADLILKSGIKSFCLDAGGDIFYQNQNSQSLRVGLEDPQNLQQVIGVATILNQSICGSAGNRRKWGEFHHIINPHTLKSPSNILATWVVANTAMLADAISTCLFFSPAKDLHKHFLFEYAMVYEDYTLEKSANFPAEFFTSNE